MTFLDGPSQAHLKFRARIWLTRLGLWRSLERRRLTWRFRGGEPHEPDFRFFRYTDGSDRLFVDIGANIGQSALSFRLFNRSSPILSFEANRELEPELAHVQRLLGPSFDYRMHGLGERNEMRTLYLPVVAGVALTQEATLVGDALATDSYRACLAGQTGRRSVAIRRQTLRLVRFDDLELTPGFVKIDVERAELQVLRGMQATLDRCRPFLLVEGEAVHAFLAGRAYRAARYSADRDALLPSAPGSGHHYNMFFVPEEAVPSLRGRGAWLDA
jgi:FkbM family methyltransferase